MSNSQSFNHAESPDKKSHLWQQYSQTFSGVTSYLDKTLRAQADIKLDDFHILTVLTQGGIYNNPPQVVRMGEIASALNVSPSRLTYQIERLIGKGWVDRTQVKEDRRGKGVFITEAGYQQYVQANKIHSELLNTVIMAKLTAKESDTFETILKRMLKTVSR